MVVLDRRDEFEGSDSNLDTVAAEAHRLYESDEFQADVVEALSGVFKQHLDCEAVDAEAEAEDVLREWFAEEGMGGLYQLRNQIVSNREADLEEGDVVHMTGTRDGEEYTVAYVVRATKPAETGAWTLRVDPDDGEISGRDLSAGHIKYVSSFEVDRSRRGDRPHKVARELAQELTSTDEAAATVTEGDDA